MPYRVLPCADFSACPGTWSVCVEILLSGPCPHRLVGASTRTGSGSEATRARHAQLHAYGVSYPRTRCASSRPRRLTVNEEFLEYVAVRATYMYTEFSNSRTGLSNEYKNGRSACDKSYKYIPARMPVFFLVRMAMCVCRGGRSCADWSGGCSMRFQPAVQPVRVLELARVLVLRQTSKSQPPLFSPHTSSST